MESENGLRSVSGFDEGGPTYGVTHFKPGDMRKVSAATLGICARVVAAGHPHGSAYAAAFVNKILPNLHGVAAYYDISDKLIDDLKKRDSQD